MPTRALRIAVSCVALAGGAFAQSQAASFTGAGSYVDVSASAFTSPTRAMTIEAWVQSPSLPLGLPTIASHSDAAGGEAWYFHVYAPRYVAFFGTFGGQSGGVRAVLPNQLATWTHFAFTYDGAEMAIYINGVQATTATHRSGPLAGGGALRIGDRVGGSSGWVGDIDEVRIWPFARTQTEIQESMNTAQLLVPNGASFNFDGNHDDSSQFLVGTATGGVSFVPGVPALGPPIPTGAVPYGVATTSCAGDAMRLGVGSTTRAGNLAFGLYCTEGPANANGGVLLAANPSGVPLPILGINLLVDPTGLLPIVPSVVSDATGTARLPISLVPSTQIGLALSAQFLFIDMTCGAAGAVSSQGITFGVQ